MIKNDKIPQNTRLDYAKNEDQPRRKVDSIH